jgi:DNA-binding transcriptional LysR family regulator
MNLNSAYIFVCVVQEKGFTAAAERLEMPKQTVSRKVAELEKELGSRLLERSTRKLRLTSEGELFYGYAVKIAELAQQASKSLGKTQQEPQGKLRISASQLFGDLVLRHVISEYMKMYPKVKVNAKFSQKAEDLYNDNIDISFQLGPLKNSSLIAKRIAPAWLGCYASAEFLEKHFTPTSPNQLMELPTLYYDDESESQGNWVFNHFTQESIEVSVQPILHTNSFWLAREAALNGVGIARLPTALCIADIKEKKLIPIFPEWSCSTGPLYAVFPSRKMLGVQIRVFLEMLEKYLNIAPNSYQASPLPAFIHSIPTLVEPNLWTERE